MWAWMSGQMGLQGHMEQYCQWALGLRTSVTSVLCLHHFLGERICIEKHGLEGHSPPPGSGGGVCMLVHTGWR